MLRSRVRDRNALPSRANSGKASLGGEAQGDSLVLPKYLDCPECFVHFRQGRIVALCDCLEDFEKHVERL